MPDDPTPTTALAIPERIGTAAPAIPILSGIEVAAAGLLTEGTKENYRRDAGRFLRDFQELLGKPWVEATWDDLVLWWIWERKKATPDHTGPDKIQPSTFNRRVVAVRRLFSEAARREIVPVNVADGLKTLKLLRRPRGRLLNVDESRRLQ